jgi:hypothetical protein
MAAESGKISRELWEDILACINDFKRKRQFGDATNRPKHTPRNYSKVKVKNNTGGDLAKGSVVEFGTFLLTEIETDYLWFNGEEPDLTRVGWGVLPRPIPSGEIDECICLGVLPALVKIEDEDHKYAARESGETVLKSQEAVGPVKILYKPTGGTPPEERECVVQLMDEVGETTEIVEVFHDTPASDGDIVEANSEGFHPGRIVTRDDDDDYIVGADIWIQFVDGFDGHHGDTDNGAVLACEGEYYGPAKPAGTFDLVENEGEEDETHDERPVYVVECSERQFLCKADSSISKGGSGTVSLYHSHDETDSGINRTAKALGAEITADKWAIYSRVAGVWYVSPWEC